MSATNRNGGVGRRDFLGLSALGGAGLLLAACGSSGSSKKTASAPIKAAVDGDTLDLFTWPDYFAPEAISSYEKKYGVKVSTTFISTGGEEFTKVAAGLPFDVAITNSTGIPQLVAANRLRVLDHAQLTNWSQVTPFFNNPPYDAGAKYSAPFAMGAMGLAYQTDRVSSSDITGSWADLWKWAPKNKGHAYLITDQVSMLGIALGYLGYNENSGVTAQVEAAANALIKLKPATGGLISEDSITQLADGQVWMMPTYNGNVYSALLQAKDPSILKFEYCKGASNFNADNMSIPVSAAHPGNALLFIDWMLAPENMAANVKLSGFAIGTTAGMAAYQELTSKYPFLFMPNSLINNVSNWNTALSGARQKLWDTQWTKVQIA